MQPNSITLDDIRIAAQTLANRNNDLAATAALLNGEIKAAIAPILEKYNGTMNAYAIAQAMAQEHLDELLMAAPHLFASPRSLSVDGVKAGYKKAPDSLDWADEAAVIAAIKSLKPELVPTLIRTSESLIIDALANVDAEDRKQIGVRMVPGVDQRYITIGDNDAEKLTKLVVMAAMQRQGEDDKQAAKKGKAKVAA